MLRLSEGPGKELWRHICYDVILGTKQMGKWTHEKNEQMGKWKNGKSGVKGRALLLPQLLPVYTCYVG